MSYQTDLQKARDAFNDGDYRRAKFHLNAAKVEGADPQGVAEWERQIEAAEHSLHEKSHTFTVGALCVAILGYLVLTVQQPDRWGIPIWAVTSFVVIPVLEGLVLSFGAHSWHTRSNRFWSGWTLGAIMMGSYTLVNLVILNSRIHSHGDATAVIFVLVLLYGAVAGLVSGLASMMFRRRLSV